MKKYLADALTALRLAAAVVLVVLTLQRAPSEYALWVFVAGQLSDAFDGIAARRWPFPADRIPRYRRFAELYDMIIDVSLGLAALAYVAVCISLVCGIALVAFTVGLGLVTEILVWGQPFGAPERCRACCLWYRNHDFAELLVLLRRRFYLIAIGTVIAIMLFATGYSLTAKISLVGSAAAIALILIIMKQDRLNEVKTK